MAKYGRKAQETVEKVMHERKAGTLRSGQTGAKVTSRKQAVAIGLSEARRDGAKVPARKTVTRASPKTTTAAKKTTRAATRTKTAAKKAAGKARKTMGNARKTMKAVAASTKRS